MEGGAGGEESQSIQLHKAFYLTRSPGVAAELRAVITARDSRNCLVRAAWPGCGVWVF